LTGAHYLCAGDALSHEVRRALEPRAPQLGRERGLARRRRAQRRGDALDLEPRLVVGGSGAAA
jgi:hypothetical protein